MLQSHQTFGTSAESSRDFSRWVTCFKSLDSFVRFPNKLRVPKLSTSSKSGFNGKSGSSEVSKIGKLLESSKRLSLIAKPDLQNSILR